MVDFAGWYMPVEYKPGLRAEHLACRSSVGLFDVSHMGELRVRGPKALETIEWLTTNYVGRLSAGQAQYSLLPNEDGGVVDDVIVYCVEPGLDYLICVNASNVEKDFEWALAHNRGADITNESESWAQIAVQGPKAMTLLTRLFNGLEDLSAFHFRSAQFKGTEVLVARTGYTGEDGAEIFVPAAQAVALWRELLTQGQDLGITPVGLGARDTLRTEMKFPLYGHEIDDAVNPYAAGLGWVIKPAQKDFVGREIMLATKERALQRKLIGFTMLERGIPRPGYTLKSVDGQREVGLVTSGTPSPSLNQNIGVGYLDQDLALEGREIAVEMRGRLVRAKVVATPFVKRAK